MKSWFVIFMAPQDGIRKEFMMFIRGADVIEALNRAIEYLHHRWEDFFITDIRMTYDPEEEFAVRERTR